MLDFSSKRSLGEVSSSIVVVVVVHLGSVPKSCFESLSVAVVCVQSLNLTLNLTYRVRREEIGVFT